MGRHDWFGASLLEAPAVDRDLLVTIHPERYVAALEELCARGGGFLDADTAAVQGDVRGGDAGGRRRDRAGRRAAGRDEPGRRLGAAAAGPPRRAVAGDGVLLLRQRRAGGPAGDRRARARAGPDPRLGRAPRQRDRGDLRPRLRRPVHLDPRVAAVSGHRPARRISARGRARATRSTCRCRAASGDAVYRSLVAHVAAPLIAAWEPQLVLVSAGFDAHRADPLASCTGDRGGLRGDDGHAAGGLRRGRRAVGAGARGRLRPGRAGGLDGGAHARIGRRQRRHCRQPLGADRRAIRLATRSRWSQRQGPRPDRCVDRRSLVDRVGGAGDGRRPRQGSRPTSEVGCTATRCARSSSRCRLSDRDRVFAVVATSGTTNVGVIDDLEGAADVADEHGWWFHVDGAYGAAALCSPTVRSEVRRHRALRQLHRRSAQVAVRAVRLLCAVYRDPIDRPRSAHPARRVPRRAARRRHGRLDWNPSDFAHHLSVGRGGCRSGSASRRTAPTRTADAVDDHAAGDRARGATLIRERRARRADHGARAVGPAVPPDRLGAAASTRPGATAMLAAATRSSCRRAWKGETVLRFCFVNPLTTRRRQVGEIVESLR